VPFETADQHIYDALKAAGTGVGSGIAIAPDVRNRETDVPAIIWSVDDSGGSQTSAGTIGPYHARFTMSIMHTTRLSSMALANDAVSALAASGNFQTRENSRRGEAIARGSESVPLYLTELDLTLTFGA
jgi:hypothetical protein